MIRHKDYLLVQVPEGTGKVTVRATVHCAHGSVSCYDKFTNDETLLFIPPGSWQLIGLASELTEDQKKEVVDWYQDSNDSSYDPQYNVTTSFIIYTDYVDGDDLDNPNDSFDSLLRSHNLNANQVVILKLIQL